MNEARNLAKQSELNRQRNEVLQSLVNDFRSTEVGKEREQRIAAEKDLQSEKLLRIWAEQREERPFYRSLSGLRNAEFIELSDDQDALPVGEAFQTLNEEIDRIFLGESADVSPREIAALIELVLVKAGFDTQASMQLIGEDVVPSDVAPLYLDRSTPTIENLRKLKLQIASDLLEERGVLEQLQYDLVDKVAAARLDRLARFPSEHVTALDPAVQDVGVAMLLQILEDLKTKMRLLRETAEGLRGTAQTRDESSESDQP
jgi:hypothetical protein